MKPPKRFGSSAIEVPSLTAALRFSVVCAVVAWCLVGNALAAPPATVQTLTGGGTREWIFKRVEIIMGSSHKCTAGERYFFEANGKVRIERCISGELQQFETTWKFMPNQTGDPSMTIGPTRYEVHFSSENAALILRLRLPSHAQQTPTIDRILRYEPD